MTYYKETLTQLLTARCESLFSDLLLIEEINSIFCVSLKGRYRTEFFVYRYEDDKFQVKQLDPVTFDIIEHKNMSIEELSKWVSHYLDKLFAKRKKKLVVEDSGEIVEKKRLNWKSDLLPKMKFDLANGLTLQQLSEKYSIRIEYVEGMLRKYKAIN